MCSKCTKGCGAQIESKINFSGCPSKSFGNDGGNLVCDDLPSGDYLRSCQNCNKGEDGSLSCSCEAGGGKRIDTRVAISSCSGGKFDNIDGQLVCSGGKAEL